MLNSIIVLAKYKKYRTFLFHFLNHYNISGGFMYRKLFSFLLTVAVVSSFSADYLFPSSRPPSKKKPADVEQYVTFIWDDNAYSGLEGTMYESKAGDITWENRSTVGGLIIDGVQTKNILDIHEDKNPLGMCYALNELAKQNGGQSGGRPIHFTFNVISGIFLPTWGESWQERESKFGGYEDLSQPYVKEVSGFKSISRSWGREMKIGKTKGSDDVQKAASVPVFKQALSDGHEVGNHTIDHTESNSPLPKDQFLNGEGFDNGEPDKLPDGREINEVELFGLASNAWAKDNGWLVYGAQCISKEAWENVIKIGEDELKEHLGQSKTYGFRAPRLEINDNCLLALEAKGYEYLCGLEEGFEEHRDGTNMLWPYTTDNGIMNNWFQLEMEEKHYINKTPAGLWTIPVNAFIVPEDIREAVWENYNKIANAAPKDEYIMSKEDFVAEGKMTGFDFNLFIIWGFDCDQTLKTLKHTLDLRLKGNKAPLQIGCHTDYFTPMYDFGTLSSEFNKGKYGLVLSENWNDWVGRKKVFSDFVKYCQDKECQIVSGHELIEEMRTLAEVDPIGEDVVDYSTESEWNFFQDGGSSANTDKFTGDIKNAVVSVKAINNDADVCGYGSYEDAGFFEELDHIALTYTTTSALILQVIVEGDKPWEVLLNNKGHEVSSGKIPLVSFEYNRFELGTEADIATNKIIGFQIKPLISGAKDEDVTFSVSDMKLYVGNGITSVKSIASISSLNNISLNTINKSMFKLNISNAGRYNVNLISANGRIVKSYENSYLSKGINNFKMSNTLSSGVYMISISDTKGKVKKSFKSMVM